MTWHLAHSQLTTNPKRAVLVSCALVTALSTNRLCDTLSFVRRSLQTVLAAHFPWPCHAGALKINHRGSLSAAQVDYVLGQINKGVCFMQANTVQFLAVCNQVWTSVFLMSPLEVHGAGRTSPVSYIISTMPSERPAPPQWCPHSFWFHCMISFDALKYSAIITIKIKTEWNITDIAQNKLKYATNQKSCQADGLGPGAVFLCVC